MDTERLISLFGLTCRRALVTGGSRGIGKMIAAGLLDAGAEVMICSRNAQQVNATAEQMSTRGTCIAVQADLSNDEGISHLTDAVAKHWDTLDILVNNAGAAWGEPLEDFTSVGWDKVMNINVRSVFFLTQKLLTLLRSAATVERPARIINVGSVNGLTPPAMQTYSYSASKAAVHMLTRHLARELTKDHITVNAVAPGPFETQMTAFALKDPTLRAALVDNVPLKRIGQADDIAGVVVYLASAASSYVTGAVVPVGGGVATIAM